MKSAFRVGDLVVISPNNLKSIRTYNRNRSHGVSYVSDQYRSMCEALIGEVGMVTHTFEPTHDTTVRFGTQLMHMRHNFVTRLVDHLGVRAIVYPSYFRREEVEEGGSLHGYYRVVNFHTGEESTLFNLMDCRAIIANAEAGLLRGSFESTPDCN